MTERKITRERPGSVKSKWLRKLKMTGDLVQAIMRNSSLLLPCSPWGESDPCLFPWEPRCSLAYTSSRATQQYPYRWCTHPDFHLYQKSISLFRVTSALYKHLLLSSPEPFALPTSDWTISSPLSPLTQADTLTLDIRHHFIFHGQPRKLILAILV